MHNRDTQRTRLRHGKTQEEIRGGQRVVDQYPYYYSPRAGAVAHVGRASHLH